LTDKQTKQLLKIAEEHQEQLLQQWAKFTAGETVKIVTIKK